MDDLGESDRKVRTKRRRSIRNLRRQSGIVPLDFMTADYDRTETDHDATEVEAVRFGSAYIESQVPVKKSRRRSSLLIKPPLCPVQLEDEVQEVDGTNIDPIFPSWHDTDRDDNPSTTSSRYPNVDSCRRASTGITIPVSVSDNCESLMNSSVQLVPKTTAELDLSPDSQDENKACATSECSLDKGFIQDSSQGTPESEPVLDQKEPSSFSPAYPFSPTAVVYSDCQNESYCDMIGDTNQNIPSGYNGTDDISGSSACDTGFVESSASIEQSFDKENIDENAPVARSSDEQMTDSTSPGFLSMCKTLAGKVVNAVKTSPSFLTNAFHGNTTTAPLIDIDAHCANTSKHLGAQLNYSAENVLGKITDEIVYDKELSEHSVPAICKVDSVVEKVDDFGSKVESECPINDMNSPRSMKKKRAHSLFLQTFGAINEKLQKDRKCSYAERDSTVNAQVSDELKDQKVAKAAEEKEVIHEKNKRESFDDNFADFQTTNLKSSNQLVKDNAEGQIGIDVDTEHSVTKHQRNDSCSGESARQLSAAPHVVDAIDDENERSRNEGLNVERTSGNTTCSNAESASSSCEMLNGCEYDSDNDQFVDAFEINPESAASGENCLRDPHKGNTVAGISETLREDIRLDIDFEGDRTTKQVQQFRELPSVCFEVEKGSGDNIPNNCIAGELETKRDKALTMEAVPFKHSNKVTCGITSRKRSKSVKKSNTVKSQINVNDDTVTLDSNSTQLNNKMLRVQTNEKVEDEDILGVVCEEQDQPESRENHIESDVKTVTEESNNTEADDCSKSEQIKDTKSETKQKARKRRSSNFDKVIKLVQDSKFCSTSDSNSGVGVRKTRRRSAEAATLKLAALATKLSEEEDIHDSVQDSASCIRERLTNCKNKGVSEESDPGLYGGTDTLKCGNKNVILEKPEKKCRDRCKSQSDSVPDTENSSSAVNGSDSDVVPSSNVTRRKRRKSADAATLKMQMIEANFAYSSPEEPEPTPKISKSKKQKMAAEGSEEWLDKYYRNKTFVRPDTHRPWQTIIESPDGKTDVFGKKRLHRYTDYDRPTQMRLRRRQQRAAKNGWDIKKRRKNQLKDDVVEEKLTKLWSELDSSD